MLKAVFCVDLARFVCVAFEDKYVKAKKYTYIVSDKSVAQQQYTYVTRF